MPFTHLLPDPGMNYTLNRPLLDGTSPARLKEVGGIAPEIKDYDSWYTAWLRLAKQAEHLGKLAGLVGSQHYQSPMNTYSYILFTCP